jgi:5-methylcytosine-specific restriction enzyme subunit McrC
MEQPSRRTLHLTERTPALCRLHPADVAFLLAEHCTHLEVLPTGRRHRYRVLPGGYVGVIVAPHSRLNIRPKIPLQNLCILLDATSPLSLTTDQTTPEPGDDLLDFLATRLAGLMTEQAASGLHRDYVEQAVQGPFVQGRLDVAAQLREPPGRKERVHSRVEDFTTDVPCNQVLRYTAERLLITPLVSDAVRAALRQALAAFTEISPLAVEVDHATANARTALPWGYRPALDLCRLLLDSLRPGESAGAVACPAFLIDLERVFEN